MAAPASVDAEQLAAFKARGYAVFRQHLDSATVAALRQELEPAFSAAFAAAPEIPKLKFGVSQVTGHSAAAVPGWSGGGLLNHPLWSTKLQPLLHHPWHTDTLLDFCECVMGPCVQLDSFGVSGFPVAPASPEEDAGASLGGLRPPTFIWHRDNFAQSQYYQTQPAGGFWGGFSPSYRRPPGMNLLCYLQDMNAETGPLRVIPGSHLGTPPTPAGGDAQLPHEAEELLDLRAGDLVAIHSDLIHAGTPNASTDTVRMYTSTYLCQVGLPHRDDFSAPAIEAYLREARLVVDSRVLRFFGDSGATAGHLRWQEEATAALVAREAAQRAQQRRQHGRQHQRAAPRL